MVDVSVAHNSIAHHNWLCKLFDARCVLVGCLLHEAAGGLGSMSASYSTSQSLNHHFAPHGSNLSCSNDEGKRLRSTPTLLYCGCHLLPPGTCTGSSPSAAAAAAGRVLQRPHTGDRLEPLGPTLQLNQNWQLLLNCHHQLCVAIPALPTQPSSSPAAADAVVGAEGCVGGDGPAPVAAAGGEMSLS